MSISIDFPFHGLARLCLSLRLRNVKIKKPTSSTQHMLSVTIHLPIILTNLRFTVTRDSNQRHDYNGHSESTYKDRRY